MNDDGPRLAALDAQAIERRFRSVPVVVTRPLIVGGVRALCFVRRFSFVGYGQEHLKNLEPPLVFAANHVSHTDTGAILSTLPRALRSRTAVAAALDVFGPKSTGRTIRNEALQLITAAGFHAFAFDRHGPPLRSVRTSVQLIRDGWSLLLYPEGTRSRSGRIGPFKAGVGVLARFTGRPVIPIHVHGGIEILPHGTFLPRPGRLTVRYGAPMRYQEGETPQAFVQRLREHICQLAPDPLEEAASIPEPQPAYWY